MVSFNRSKAKKDNSGPELDVPLSSNYFGPNQTSVFQNPYFSADSFEVNHKYINESVYDVSIITSTGMVIDLPKKYTTSNRIVICVQFKWGPKTSLNIPAMYKHWSGLTDEHLDKLLSNIKDFRNSSPRSLDLYYVVNLEDIEEDPYGIWVEDLNVQIVHTSNSTTTTFFTNDCFFTRNDDLYEQEQFVWGSVLSSLYITDDPEMKEPMYLPFGNDVIRIDPVYLIGQKPGLHLNLRGEVGFSSRRENIKSLHIPPEDFKKYGAFATIREWRENVKNATKGMTKEEAVKLMYTFDKFHGLLYDEEMEAVNIKDVKLFGNFTLGNAVEFIGEVAKIDAYLDKIFKKK